MQTPRHHIVIIIIVIIISSSSSIHKPTFKSHFHNNCDWLQQLDADAYACVI